MNDNDKKIFNEYICSHDQGILQHSGDTDIDVAERAWQAACKYKQKEIDELIKQLKHEHDLYKKHLKVYEDENAKLRLVVDHYANMRGFGAYARIILRELGDK